MEQSSNRSRIRVVGIGGAGGNAINALAKAQIRNVEFVAMNTDYQALSQVAANCHLRLGEQNIRGIGAGGDPLAGMRAAEESEATIAEVLAGTELVILTLGLGGGTGTGAGPVVARIARRLGALVIGMVTLPFRFEGPKRNAIAVAGLADLRMETDNLIAIPNDRLSQATHVDTSLRDAFDLANEVWRQGIVGIADLMTVPGLINLDYADLRAVMSGTGTSLIAVGEAEGVTRADKATRMALSNAFLGLDARGARGIICNVTGGEDLALSEVQVVAETVSAEANSDATLLFGALTDVALSGRLRVTVIASGFDGPQIPLLGSDVDFEPLFTTRERLVIAARPTEPLGLPAVVRKPLRNSAWLTAGDAADSWPPQTAPTPALPAADQIDSRLAPVVSGNQVTAVEERRPRTEQTASQTPAYMRIPRFIGRE